MGHLHQTRSSRRDPQACRVAPAGIIFETFLCYLILFCRVALAVDRSEAKRLKDEENVAGRDKRNLYLATEGLLVDSAVSLKRHGNEQ